MDFQIKSIDDLREEILRIRVIENQQSTALASRFSSPSAIFSSVVSLLNSGNRNDVDKHPGIFNQDFLGLLSRIVLPVTLNRTLFKKSNFLVKTLVGLVSQKASSYISEDSFSGIWGSVKGAFEKFTKKKPAYNYKPEPYKKPISGPVV
ncbi:hypothetical protein [Mucilaginibacter sp. FT3.2]|uniref:hypothetical protein n=1 Tax=Mucilaginibacter sp. FT3.2 TaxID=2723090 RepID=UPI0016214705|nr:hypothetical protein [Mucilaginibacter sp. FT3.2]MBB6231819.1 hypothetical protein [Mucilaginibacter sp. FT3.2]